MLYLEARCLAVVRAAGSQGVQNGSISCVALALSVPGGTREVLAENVLAAWLDLEVASGQRRDREPLRDPQDREADGPVPAGYGLRHVRLLVDAALRQHVRRRQLRLARLRRVADDSARLAGRRRDRAARRGRGARRARAGRAGHAGGVRRARLPADLATRRCASPRRASTRATCRTAIARPTSLAGDRVLVEGISGLDVARALDRRGLRATSPRRSSACSASASPPTTSRPRRSSTRTGASSRRSTTPNEYSGPGTGYRLEGARWERLRRLPHAIDARLLGRASAGRAADARGRDRRSRRRARTRS